MIETGQRIVVVDLRIPFVRLVLFFVKAALAAIPAAIIIGFLLMLVTALFPACRRRRSRHDAAVVLSSDHAINRSDIP